VPRRSRGPLASDAACRDLWVLDDRLIRPVVSARRRRRGRVECPSPWSSIRDSLADAVSMKRADSPLRRLYSSPAIREELRAMRFDGRSGSCRPVCRSFLAADRLGETSLEMVVTGRSRPCRGSAAQGDVAPEPIGALRSIALVTATLGRDHHSDACRTGECARARADSEDRIGRWATCPRRSSPD